MGPEVAPSEARVSLDDSGRTAEDGRSSWAAEGPRSDDEGRLSSLDTAKQIND